MKAIFIFLFSFSLHAIDYQGGDIHANDMKWMNANLYRGDNQRGGPRKFDDTYFELEFGGRSGIIDFYGYVDYIDIFNDERNSDQGGFDNSFSKVDLRFSFDAIFEKDLAVGIVKEWYLATSMIDGDYNGNFGGGLRVHWFGVGTDTELPWLGLVGLNLYARYFVENFGATNEEKFDGYNFHMNWFKPFKFFKSGDFLSFQGYFDYEFGSEIKGPARTPTAFQTYLGVWYHSKYYAFGYGSKLYDNMNNFRHKDQFFGSSVNSTGIGHYFNVTYKF